LTNIATPLAGHALISMIYFGGHRFLNVPCNSEMCFTGTDVIATIEKENLINEPIRQDTFLAFPDQFADESITIVPESVYTVWKTDLGYSQCNVIVWRHFTTVQQDIDIVNRFSYEISSPFPNCLKFRVIDGNTYTDINIAYKDSVDHDEPVIITGSDIMAALEICSTDRLFIVDNTHGRLQLVSEIVESDVWYRDIHFYTDTILVRRA
jgi:hypothetical protein